MTWPRARFGVSEYGHMLSPRTRPICPQIIGMFLHALAAAKPPPKTLDLKAYPGVSECGHMLFRTRSKTRDKPFRPWATHKDILCP